MKQETRKLPFVFYVFHSWANLLIKTDSICYDIICTLSSDDSGTCYKGVVHGFCGSVVLVIYNGLSACQSQKILTGIRVGRNYDRKVYYIGI